MDRLFFALGSVSALIAVALGAFAAHGLKSRLEPAMLATFETGAAGSGLGLYALAGDRGACERLVIRRRHRALLGQPVRVEPHRRALAGRHYARRWPRVSRRMAMSRLDGVEGVRLHQ